MTSSSENTSATDAQRWFIRRSESWPTWAAAGRRASRARARTIGWKLPLLSIRPDATSTSGLSSMALSSSCAADRSSVTNSRNAPWTCGPTRNDSGSWTERGPPGWNSALPVRNPRMLAPAASCPCTRFARSTASSRTEGLPAVASSEAASTRSAAAATRSARSTSSAACPIATPFAEIRVSPSFGSSSIGASPAAASACAPGMTCAADLGGAVSEQDLRDRRHVHQVRRADRARRGHDRVDPGVEQVDERLRDLPARARAAAGDAVEAGGHRGPHDDRGERRPDGALVRPHDERLEAPERRTRERDVTLVPEAGVEAVDERRAVDDAVHDRAARLDHPPGVVVETHPRPVRDRDEVVERELGGPDHDVRRARVGHAGLSSSTHSRRQSGAANGSAQ